jgi:putative phage-type endonuclease
MPQRSEEWYAVKCGKISASSLSDVLAKGKGITRRNYMLRLVAERLSGIPQKTYCNGAMEWGIATEPIAKAAYEEHTLTAVQEVGFVECDEFLGCSPDGMIGEDGLIEIKCPETPTHLDYILSGGMPSEYAVQVQGQLWITNRQWCDFVSYDPRLPEECRLFVRRVERDEKRIDEIKQGVALFIDEMLETEKKVKGRVQ